MANDSQNGKMAADSHSASQIDRADAHNMERPGPYEHGDPQLVHEFKKAVIWASVILAFALVILYPQPILIIIGSLVIASILDGGTRLLGRILPIARGFRLILVMLMTIAFLAWAITFAGTQIAMQAAILPAVVSEQIDQIGVLAVRYDVHFDSQQITSLGSQVMGGVGQLTAAVTSFIGGVGSMGMMLVLGVFIVAEPRLYERGLAWMLPISERAYFYGTVDKIG